MIYTIEIDPCEHKHKIKKDLEELGKKIDENNEKIVNITATDKRVIVVTENKKLKKLITG
jgi:hypothetical protein